MRDRPVRVGDFCKYGDDVGTIEAIGIRSTRIRGLDRTVTTIPNGVLSKMPIVNLTLRDRMLLKMVIRLRNETTPEQLRFVLAKLRELLLAHPMVTQEPSRVRFVGIGDCSLNLEVFAYVGTKDFNEFLEVQEDINLRMMDVVAASGTGFAFPSQTLYFARDEVLDLKSRLRPRQRLSSGALHRISRSQILISSFAIPTATHWIIRRTDPPRWDQKIKVSAEQWGRLIFE